MQPEREQEKELLLSQAIQLLHARQNHGHSSDHDQIPKTNSSLPTQSSTASLYQDNIELFLNIFYKHASFEDLADRSPESILGAAMSLWSFARERASGELKVRILNPNMDEHGWSSTHSVIEIINDDMPFLVDSVMAELNLREISINLILHPILTLERDAEGRLIRLIPGAEGQKNPVLQQDSGFCQESMMHIEIDAQSSPEVMKDIVLSLEKILLDVRYATSDWRSVCHKVSEDLSLLNNPVLSREHQELVQESRDFVQWILDNNFTFLGYRRYDLESDGVSLKPIEDSGLGILRDASRIVFDGFDGSSQLTPEVQHFIHHHECVMITKANKQSTVHRRTHMDVVLLKRFDPSGKVVGLSLIEGLFTSTAYHSNPLDIPLVRLKVNKVLENAGYRSNSHDGKALLHILQTYPRSELFQSTTEDLIRISLGILQLQERQKTAIFIRRDAFERFISCMVYLPRERYNNSLRRKIANVLEKSFNGMVTAYYPSLPDDSVLARLHFIVKTESGHIPDYDPQLIREHVVEVSRDWSDGLKEALVDARGEEQGVVLHKKYANAFPIAYCERFKPVVAVHDVDRLEKIFKGDQFAMNLYRPFDSDDHELFCKIYHPNHKVNLSDILPMLENMGLMIIDEMPYCVSLDQGVNEGVKDVWIHDFGIRLNDQRSIDLSETKSVFEECFAKVWEGSVENDPLNKLVLRGRLNWHEVSLFRAYSKYLRQTGIPYSPEYISETLVNHPEMVVLLLEYFDLVFNPLFERHDDASAKGEVIRSEFQRQLEKVSNLDEDKILSYFQTLIDGTLRTNFYQKDSQIQPKPYISFKFSSQKIGFLPLPRPYAEIFVYSPRVEAVHLRGGKVARGGIRWSDRKEDFRTEVLGLMKAQMVKNSVIVPVGSKGGFVVKKLPKDGTRDEILAEVIECYKTMMRGLLDLTDNFVHDQIVPPIDVIRLDEDDPYLVVAADKGTATFSDIANSVSAEYGFWLGDAFASGGSAGYDHKKIGITARGAWKSVERHFRELGIDIENNPFTVIGIGDMAGDVFGNGMLLSPNICLVGAFNHQHIFVDPHPDPLASFQERQRLFCLPRSMWSDYDEVLISEGGGVFERSAKSILISPEMKSLFDIRDDRLAPNDLIKAMLRAKVDLMWFGGIGTFVKASQEDGNNIGDRSNDPLRVNAKELRCKIIGEGANLALTQRARIEFAQQGGKINTDWIDNVGGVNCSDHEVNIKILLDKVVHDQDMTLKQRNELLEKMTQDVAEHVLEENILQSQAISLIEASMPDTLDMYKRIIYAMESRGRLNRELEFLPDDNEIEYRKANQLSLTRPEIAVILSYAKMMFYDAILESDLPDDPMMVHELHDYFPSAIPKKLGHYMAGHRLKREIVATCLTNAILDRVGPHFFYDLHRRTGASIVAIVRAFLITREVFGLRETWCEIEKLGGAVSIRQQYEMLQETMHVADRGTSWFLRNLNGFQNHHAHPSHDIVKRFTKGVHGLASKLHEILPESRQKSFEKRKKSWIQNGVPEDLAVRISGLDMMGSACDIVQIADYKKQELDKVGRLYFNIGERFGLRSLRTSAHDLGVEGDWDIRAVNAVIEDFFGQQAALTLRILEYGLDHRLAGSDKILNHWCEHNQDRVEQADRMLRELQESQSLNVSMLIVANRQLRSLIGR